MTIKFYNTLSKKIETFKPLKKRQVGLYTCGPTVYNYAHIGNLRTYVFEDILKRILRYNGYKVKHVMNITDVGHLTDNADMGEDKIENSSAREGKTAWEIAKFYTQKFKNDLSDLNIIAPDIWCQASEHIKEQIKQIKKLEKNGYSYQTRDGIYFDTAKSKNYGQLANLKNQKLAGGKRVALKEKKTITDFALWKFSPTNAKRQMEWPSPWGIGFPGWHIECSAMSAKYLGQPFDIHCGGIDHIPVHHTNEIAQSEGAENKPLAKYWLHGEFLLTGQAKMAKSANNFLILKSVTEKHLSPIAYRYFLLQTHYRQQLNFSWEALTSADHGLKHLYRSAKQLPTKLSGQTEIKEQFLKLVNTDLSIPAGLAFIWERVKTKGLTQATLIEFDKILGLQIKEHIYSTKILPDKIQKLIKIRDNARKNKAWTKSDILKKKIEDFGYVVADTANGTQVSQK